MYRLDLTKSFDYFFFSVCRLSTHCKIIKYIMEDRTGLHPKQQKVKMNVIYVFSFTSLVVREDGYIIHIVLVR